MHKEERTRNEQKNRQKCPGRKPMCAKLMRKINSALQMPFGLVTNQHFKKGPLKVLIIEEIHSF